MVLINVKFADVLYIDLGNIYHLLEYVHVIH